MKLKRNDPCHCGSGKKYKHCHMREDQAEKSASRDAAAQSEMPLPSVISDFETRYGDADQKHPDEPWAKLYSRFAKADYTERKSVLRTAIEEDELDGETIFELFNQLYPQMMANGDEQEFLMLSALARSRQPAAYEEENHWFWEWEIVAALKADDEGALQRITDELIDNGGHDIENFLSSLNCLLYHGKLDILCKAIDKFEPASFSDDYFGKTLKTFQNSLGYLILLNYIEHHEQGALLDEANVDQLSEQVACYSEMIQREEVVDFVTRAGGLANSTWTLDDFQLDPLRYVEEDNFFDEEDADKDEDPADENFQALGREFIRYAHNVEGISLTRAYLAREYLIDYFTARQAEQIRAEDAAMGWPGREYYARKRKPTANLLLPTYVTAEEYLQRFFGWFATGTYQALALFMAMPTWVRFVESKELADQKNCQQSLSELEPLRNELEKGISKHADSRLVADLRQWR